MTTNNNDLYNFIIQQKKILEPVKENPNDHRIDLLLKWSNEGLNNVIKYNTLDYNYYIRILFQLFKKKENINTYKKILNDPLLNHLINKSFNYYKFYENEFKNDITLNSLIKICTNKKLRDDPNIIDSYLTILSQYFNHISNTNRKLLRCYDCGTNARGIFLNLITTNRNNILTIHDNEKQRLLDMYKNYESDPIPKIKECKEFIKNVKKNTVIIICLGLVESGHVYVLEKRFINNKENVQQYQSALNSHMVLDFLEAVDIVSKLKKNISLNYSKMLDDLIYLFSLQKWTDNDKKIFAKWFFYVFSHDININDMNDFEQRCNFNWTYITY